jgi:RNA-binding protein
MERVGAVTGVAGGVVVARADEGVRPDLGSEVIDESLDRIGRIVDVFGPVGRPYVAITPDDDVRTAPLVGERLYAR